MPQSWVVHILLLSMTTFVHYANEVGAIAIRIKNTGHITVSSVNPQC